MNLIIAAGGTGGHVAPGLAVAKEWKKKKGRRVLMVGSDRGVEVRMAAAAGERFESIPAAPLRRPLWDPRNLLMPLKVAAGVFAGSRLIEREQPAAVLATGGWVSVPMGLAARLKGIPLVLHESNAWPGVATRLLAKMASAVCLGFKEAAPVLAPAPCRVTGNPSRLGKLPAKAAALKKMGLKAGGPVLLVMPGSGAAQAINQALADRIWTLQKDVPRARILWMAGAKGIEAVGEKTRGTKLGVKLFTFIEDVAAAYAAADLVLCRAGSATLAELAEAGKASAIVPYPYATGGHQLKNARAFEAAGAAMVKEEKGNGLDELMDGLSKVLLKRPALLQRMGKAAKKLGDGKAAARIVAAIEKTFHKGKA